MTGTQSHEAIAGALAAVEYLADLGRTLAANDSLPRRAALREAYREIGLYERGLVARLLAGLDQMPDIKVWGINAPERIEERVATVSFTHDRFSAAADGRAARPAPAFSPGTATTTPSTSPRRSASNPTACSASAWSTTIRSRKWNASSKRCTDCGTRCRARPLWCAATPSDDLFLSSDRHEGRSLKSLMPLFPTNLDRLPDGRLAITWSDGQRRLYTIRALREACPCATCREKRSQPADPFALPTLKQVQTEPLRIAAMQPMGNYAYSIALQRRPRHGHFCLRPAAAARRGRLSMAATVFT